MIKGERYTDQRARDRMAAGNCPECGHSIQRHDGGGGPGCSLTDNGVALRLAVYAEEARQSSGSPQAGFPQRAVNPAQGRPSGSP